MRLPFFLSRSIAKLRSWIRSVAHRDRLETEMLTELENHLEYLTADLVRSGCTQAEARRRAALALGPSLRHREDMRASLGLRWWDGICADLRYGVRMLRKSPGFAAVATISLALAIGANTTIFSVAKQLLYERLAVPRAAELRLFSWIGDDHVAIHSVWGDYDPLPGNRETSTAFSYPIYQQLRAENQVLEDLFAFKQDQFNATIRGSAQRVRGEMVSGNYYSQLGLQPILGRGITPVDDAKIGQGAVVVIGHSLWEHRFDSAPNVLGEVIYLNDVPFTIVGVNPKDFTTAEDVQSPADVFLPLSMQSVVSPKPGETQPISDPELWWVNVMARVKSGIDDRTAQAALDTQLAAAIRATASVGKNETLPHMDLRDGSRGLFRQEQTFAKPMAVLMTLVGFVLLLACANIANLMLARGEQRQREISVRLALGAGRARILRQMLIESLLLSAIGGALGLVAAYLCRNVLPSMIRSSWDPDTIQVHFDWGVFAFTAVVTMMTGVLFGLTPAWTAARYDVNSGLKDGAQNATRRRKGLGSRALVGFQIALSTLLVIGAGLFLRTLAGLSAVPVGFHTDHLVLFDVDPQRSLYPPGKDIQLHERLTEAFAAVPGVQAVTPASLVYIADDRSRRDFHVEDGNKKPDEAEYYNVVGNNFFESLGIRIVAGRGFGAQDTATSMKVGVINQSLARKRFPDQDPIGRQFSISADQPDSQGHRGRVSIQIVGICADTHYSSLRDDPPPQFILPYVQRSEVGGMSYEVRTQLPLESIMPALRKGAQQIDSNLPLGDVRTQDQQIQVAMQEERLFVTLTSGFGLLALALASVGVYGMMAYSVARRTNEIGIRLALGAQSGQVRAMIVRESTWLAIAGISAGLAGVVLLTRLVRSMLYRIGPYDPVSLCGGVALLLLVAIGASWIPALRASRIEPMEALRHE